MLIFFFCTLKIIERVSSVHPFWIFISMRQICTLLSCARATLLFNDIPTRENPAGAFLTLLTTMTSMTYRSFCRRCLNIWKSLKRCHWPLNSLSKFSMTCWSRERPLGAIAAKLLRALWVLGFDFSQQKPCDHLDQYPVECAGEFNSCKNCGGIKSNGFPRPRLCMTVWRLGLCHCSWTCAEVKASRTQELSVGHLLQAIVWSIWFTHVNMIIIIYYICIYITHIMYIYIDRNDVWFELYIYILPYMCTCDMCIYYFMSSPWSVVSGCMFQNASALACFEAEVAETISLERFLDAWNAHVSVKGSNASTDVWKKVRTASSILKAWRYQNFDKPDMLQFCWSKLCLYRQKGSSFRWWHLSQPNPTRCWHPPKANHPSHRGSLCAVCCQCSWGRWWRWSCPFFIGFHGRAQLQVGDAIRDETHGWGGWEEELG